jgi:hypothetical protein
MKGFYADASAFVNPATRLHGGGDQSLQILHHQEQVQRIACAASEIKLLVPLWGRLLTPGDGQSIE